MRHGCDDSAPPLNYTAAVPNEDPETKEGQAVEAFIKRWAGATGTERMVGPLWGMLRAYAIFPAKSGASQWTIGWLYLGLEVSAMSWDSAFMPTPILRARGVSRDRSP